MPRYSCLLVVVSYSDNDSFLKKKLINGQLARNAKDAMSTFEIDVAVKIDIIKWSPTHKQQILQIEDGITAHVYVNVKSIDAIDTGCTIIIFAGTTSTEFNKYNPNTFSGNPCV